MATSFSPSAPPSAADVAKRFAEWDAEETAIKSRHSAEEELEERRYQQTRKDVETSIEKEKSALSAAHPSVLQFLERSRSNRLDKLQREFEARKAERKKSLDERLQDHFEGYGAFIGLASVTVSCPLSIHTTPAAI